MDLRTVLLLQDIYSRNFLNVNLRMSNLDSLAHIRLYLHEHMFHLGSLKRMLMSCYPCKFLQDRHQDTMC